MSTRTSMPPRARAAVSKSSGLVLFAAEFSGARYVHREPLPSPLSDMRPTG
ncbi:hypothetical protein ABZ723_25730 [Streptomyces sp. NPDC006700]|uniref:hypothetical protein n=1 Tax=unclassified Streptomyces TaxID=2593676 RepID=UPI0033E49618